MWRAALTQDALLSLDEAAEALPGETPRNRSWVQMNVATVGDVAGVAVYRWGDVVARVADGRDEVLPPGTIWLSTREAAARLGISRSTLDGMVGRAPVDLPGAPVVAGAGSRRRRWKWDAERLQTWLVAFTEWDRRHPTKPALRQRRSKRAATQEPRPVDWNAAGRSR